MLVLQYFLVSNKAEVFCRLLAQYFQYFNELVLAADQVDVIFVWVGKGAQREAGVAWEEDSVVFVCLWLVHAGYSHELG